MVNKFCVGYLLKQRCVVK